jgi:hypothetical protein
VNVATHKVWAIFGTEQSPLPAAGARANGSAK